MFLPIIRQRLSGDSAHEFIEKKSKRARVITVSSPWWPQWLLHLQRSNNRIVIQHIDSAIQSAKSRLMGKQLCERNVIFATLSKLWPELCYPLVEVDFVFLQRMQETCAADSFRRRPD